MPLTDSVRFEHAQQAEPAATDLTDAEWALLAPHLPMLSCFSQPYQVDLREVFSVILYLLRTGCPWHLLLRKFPLRSTLSGYFRCL